VPVDYSDLHPRPESGEGMTRPVELTVVVPMRNAGATVGRVVQSFLSVPSVVVEVIVVDDASTDDSVAQVESLDHPAVRVLRQQSRAGAGCARNRGFAEATGTYAVFFDADDELHPTALSAALAALADTEADLAFLPYRYRRSESTDFEGMNSYDQQVWTHYLGDQVPLATQPRRVARLAEVPRLLGFSNYPWNKIIRTQWYHQSGLSFGGTPVHNDILGHWQVLLQARTLVLLDDPLCTHIVTDEGNNLTNESSEIRLTLFDALDETYTFLAAHPDLRNRYSHHYWDFALRVAGWAAQRIDAEHMPEFHIRLQRHLLRMNLVDFTRIRAQRDPALATRIVRRVLG
jgi:glycosyltransferase involved in cell wall biosynthesis